MYDEERYGGPLRLLYGGTLRFGKLILADMTTSTEETPMRADARRSRAKLLEAATAAFAENGADAPLDDIARPAAEDAS